MKGLEPPRLSALDPKSSAATNYATSAWNIFLNRAANIQYFYSETGQNLNRFPAGKYNLKVSI